MLGSRLRPQQAQLAAKRLGRTLRCTEPCQTHHFNSRHADARPSTKPTIGCGNIAGTFCRLIIWVCFCDAHALSAMAIVLCECSVVAEWMRTRLEVLRDACASMLVEQGGQLPLGASGRLPRRVSRACRGCVSPSGGCGGTTAFRRLGQNKSVSCSDTYYNTAAGCERFRKKRPAMLGRVVLKGTTGYWHSAEVAPSWPVRRRPSLARLGRSVFSAVAAFHSLCFWDKSLFLW